MTSLEKSRENANYRVLYTLSRFTARGMSRLEISGANFRATRLSRATRQTGIRPTGIYRVVKIAGTESNAPCTRRDSLHFGVAAARGRIARNSPEYPSSNPSLSARPEPGEFTLIPDLHEVNGKARCSVG